MGDQVTDSNVESRFLRNWMLAVGALGAVLLVLGLLAAPMLLPVLLGETWWVFVLMGFAYLLVISFICAVGESL